MSVLIENEASERLLQGYSTVGVCYVISYIDGDELCQYRVLTQPYSRPAKPRSPGWTRSSAMMARTTWTSCTGTGCGSCALPSRTPKRRLYCPSGGTGRPQ